MTVVEILRAARERIEDPERWCRGAFAKTASGTPVEPWEPEAERWCAVGAVVAVQARHEEALRARLLLDDASYADSATATNDHSRHVAVLRMYDRAIKSAEKQEGFR
jgi:hypothetical protein